MRKGHRAITRLFSLLLSLLFIMSSVSIVASADEIRQGVVGDSDVNVRTGPGTSYSKLSFKLSSGYSVDILSEHADAGGGSIPWYKVSFVRNSTTYEGYIRSDLVTVVPPADPTVIEEKIAAFPSDYKPGLRLILQMHPNWNFELYDTGLDWSYVQSRENRNGYSYINDGIESHYSTAPGCYNWETDTYIVKEGSNWYQAHPDMVAYYMDPRNFLNENDIFQFELLGFSSATHIVENIARMMEGTFMEGKTTTNAAGETVSYARAFYEVAVEANVSPFHLISRCIQEVGWSGNGCSLGTYSGYVGYYNFFNIGAHDGATSGMKYAKENGWNTAYKAILGGAKLIGEKYIAVGQNTPYFQKFNVINKSNVGSHQYMTNIAAAFSEGRIQRRKYNSMDMLDNAFTFTIPVYDNMPSAPCMQPPASGSLNNYLSDLWVEGYDLEPVFSFKDSFENGRTSYSVTIPNNFFSLAVGASAASGSATVSGDGEYFPEDITGGKIVVKCTNSSGSARTYTIQVNLVEPTDPPDDPTEESSSGSTGDCIWALNGTVLTVSGSGAMGAYTESEPAPWGTSVTEIVIDSGVTLVGASAFAGCAELKTVSIPKTVTSIGDSSFAGCTALENVLYEGSLAEREGISIGSNNEPLAEAVWKYDVCFNNSTTNTHVYDNDCDEICNYCGTKRTVSHAYDGVCDEDCNVCGAARAVTHSYDDDCDADCNLCGATRTPAHAYDNDCDSDCNLCGATRTTHHYTTVVDVATVHTLTNSTSYPFTESEGWYVSTNKTKSTSSTFTVAAQHDCTLTLNYKVSSEANYDKLYVKHGSTQLDAISGEVTKSTTVTLEKGDVLTLTYTKDGRTDGGSDCGAFKISCSCTEEKEVLSDTLTPTCTEAVVCSRCKAVVKAALSHSYDHACDVDCNVCGATRQGSGHSYDNDCDATCNVCGARRTASHVYDGAEDMNCNVCGAERPPYVVGDLDGNGAVTMDDAIYLLFAVNFPDSYPVSQLADYDKSGEVTMDDAIYLLFAVNFPESYPLT